MPFSSLPYQVEKDGLLRRQECFSILPFVALGGGKRVVTAAFILVFVR